MKLTVAEIIDLCIYGLTKGNPDAVPALLQDLRDKLKELEEKEEDCAFCKGIEVECTRFSGIEISD